jgi:hypothetical protein
VVWNPFFDLRAALEGANTSFKRNDLQNEIAAFLKSKHVDVSGWFEERLLDYPGLNIVASGRDPNFSNQIKEKDYYIAGQHRQYDDRSNWICAEIAKIFKSKEGYGGFSVEDYVKGILEQSSVAPHGVWLALRKPSSFDIGLDENTILMSGPPTAYRVTYYWFRQKIDGRADYNRVKCFGSSTVWWGSVERNSEDAVFITLQNQSDPFDRVSSVLRHKYDGLNSLMYGITLGIGTVYERKKSKHSLEPIVASRTVMIRLPQITRDAFVNYGNWAGPVTDYTKTKFMEENEVIDFLKKMSLTWDSIRPYLYGNAEEGNWGSQAIYVQRGP